MFILQQKTKPKKNFIWVSNVFSIVVLIEDTVNKQTNIANRTQIIKNPNWWEASQLVIYKTRPRSWTRDYREQIQKVVGWRIWNRNLQFQIQRPKPLGHATSLKNNKW